MLRKPFDKGETVRFDYDLHTYFNGILGGEPRPLEKKRVALTVAPRTVYTDMFDYAKETVWYGRRRGASIYSRREAFVSQGDNPEEGA